MYHVLNLDWGHPGCDDALQDALNREDQNGFYLDRIVPMVYPWVVPGQVVGDYADDDVVEQRCEIIVITGDTVLPR